MTSTDNVRLGVGLDRRARALDPDELAEILEGALDGGARLIVMCDDVHEDGWAEPIGRLLGKRRDETEPLARAHAEHALSVAAVDYSLADRRAEARFLPAARELGLPVLACRP